MNITQAKRLLNQKWYVMGGNAVPAFLNPAAYSGLTLLADLGFEYRFFALTYENHWTGMHYLEDDLDRLWNKIKKRVAKDSQYLVKIRERYQKNFAIHRRGCDEIGALDLKSVSEQVLLTLLKKSVQAQVDSVGLAHLTEPIGLRAGHELQEQLKKYIPDETQVNTIFATLSAPTKPSFIAREEQELAKIARLPRSAQTKALAEHINNYFWIRNSYDGPEPFTQKDCTRRLAHVKPTPKNDTVQQKQALIKRLGLDQKTRQLIQIVDFGAVWQDERKENILRVISALGAALDEIARRLKMNKNIVRQLGTFEMQNLSAFDLIVPMIPELKKRESQGVMFIQQKNKEDVFSGKEYRALLPVLAQTHEKGQNEITGFVANAGTAIGKVVICNTMADMQKVRSGMILVSAMTRPELAPVLKKVAAIVTDEGGITSHAAIVSRELGIPCIIGTKIATKIFKDGDLVEVDANKGVVRKI